MKDQDLQVNLQLNLDEDIIKLHSQITFTHHTRHFNNTKDKNLHVSELEQLMCLKLDLHVSYN
jgi:hypothetical protein